MGPHRLRISTALGFEVGTETETRWPQSGLVTTYFNAAPTTRGSSPVTDVTDVTDMYFNPQDFDNEFDLDIVAAIGGK